MSGEYGCYRQALNILEVELQGSCGPPYGPWEANPDPLQEQQIFLTVQPSFEFHKTQGNRDGSVINGEGCSFRRCRFDSKDQHGDL